MVEPFDRGTASAEERGPGLYSGTSNHFTWWVFDQVCIVVLITTMHGGSLTRSV